jgi:transcriptional regulator GlxA family with amidase domain
LRVDQAKLRFAMDLIMEIVVVGFDGCLGAAFVGSVDMLKLGAQLICEQAISEDEKAAPFKVTSASFDGRPFEDSSGRRLNVDTSLAAIVRCDAIIVPGYLCGDGARFLAAPSIATACAWLRRQHAQGAVVCGSCSGVFLLGEAGLLDGRRCTTTWWRHDELKDRYPRTEAIWGASLIDDRRVVTTGGPLSWIDLSLHVVRLLCGSDAAKRVADFAVVDTVPSSQSAYVPPGHLEASNRFLLEAEHAVRAAGEDPISVQDLARAFCTSSRTLNRRLKQASGESPKQFIDRVRFETARTLLETTTGSLKQLAASAGYGDLLSFRRAFLRHSGMTPGAYRSQTRQSRKGA